LDDWVSQTTHWHHSKISEQHPSYKANGKAYHQEAKTSPFALVQQHPGSFEITSIAHQQKRCQANVNDLKFTVHPLPSAKVGQGKRIYQDIHEGEEK
jgi:nucleoporin POM152